ncbi:hypothetical protein A2U01_0088461, partial [Trifolium medium]|nr:hypothetical protein [Trifolium medium]
MNSSNIYPARAPRALPGASAPPRPASCAPRQQQQQNLFSASTNYKANP